LPPAAESVAEYADPTKADGSDVVVMVGVVRMETDSDWDAEFIPAESVVVTANWNGLPVAVDGVPVMAPEEALRLRPGGRFPLTTVHWL
jgi:hypothetical protein